MIAPFRSSLIHQAFSTIIRLQDTGSGHLLPEPQPSGAREPPINSALFLHEVKAYLLEPVWDKCLKRVFMLEMNCM